MSKLAAKEVEAALRKTLGSFGLDHVKLEEGFDHDGEAAVFVTAELMPRIPAIPGEISASASVAVAEALKRAGDERLSYLYLRRPDDERPEDEKSTVSSP
jgi:hypothetical protein